MNKQPRIFMIGWEYPPHNSGGLGVACDGLTRALSAQNAEIYFTLPYAVPSGFPHLKLVQCFDPDWSPEDVMLGSPLSAYGSGGLSLLESELTQPILDSNELHLLPQSELDARVSQYADLVLDRSKKLHNKFDVIHAHDWMSLPAAHKVSQHSHKPYIAHVHSTEFDRVPHGHGSQFIHEVEYQGLHQADHIIAVSYYTKYLLVHQYGLPQSKISVIHNGIDPLSHTPEAGRHHFASSRPVVVFMGRLTMQKGGEFYLKVAQEVLRKLPGALFIVAGSGDMYHQLLLSAAYDQLSAHVLFSGFVRDRQRELLLDRADVFVMPSVSEPFGLVALEAAQRHTPVIVSKQSGVAEVLPSAIQVDFWDIDQMSQSIVNLLQNQDHSHHVVAGQLDNLQSLTWQSSAQKVMGVYRELFSR